MITLCYLDNRLTTTMLTIWTIYMLSIKNWGNHILEQLRIEVWYMRCYFWISHPYLLSTLEEENMRSTKKETFVEITTYKVCVKYMLKYKQKDVFPTINFFSNLLMKWCVCFILKIKIPNVLNTSIICLDYRIISCSTL